MRPDREQQKIVWLLAFTVSLLATAYFFRTGQLLLYGDAVAHINIARRVIDNITPGPFQLGTVWLPLPHLLMLPLVPVDRLWVNGLAGTVPSMIAYVFATVGIYRLLTLLTSRPAAWVGTLFFAFNPNLLYMQSTAMTESIYLAEMIWVTYWLCEFDVRLRDKLPGAGRSLQYASIALSAGILTRYDGWFFAGCCGVAVMFRILSLDSAQRRPLLRPAIHSAALCVAFAGFWLAWNYGIFGSALEFANGPYSAKAIAARSTPKGDPPYPGQDHPGTAATYFLRSAKLNMTEGRLENWIFGAAVFALVFTCFEKRRRFALLLWTPLIFYSLSIAYGAVPIFIPEWWPFSYYNVRYGMQLLPAIVVFFALASHYLRRVQLSRLYVRVITATFVMIGVLAYVSVWRKTPITLREARVNSVTRVAMEKQIATQLGPIPASDTILMFTGEYSGALQREGIPFKRVINEGNFGIWQSSVQRPFESAEWVVATQGDEISQYIDGRDARAEIVAVIHVQGKRPVTIYRTHRGGH